MLPQARITPGVTYNVIRNELTQNGNVVGAARNWCPHDMRGHVWYFDEFSVAGRMTSAQASPEAGLNGAIPGVFMLAQPRLRP